MGSKTFSSVQIMNLLDPGRATKDARKRSLIQSKFDIPVYSVLFNRFRRQYQSTYTEEFMRKLGYHPKSTLQSASLDENKFLDYIRVTYDSSALSLISSIIEAGPVDITMYSKFQLQMDSPSGYTWNTEEDRLTKTSNSAKYEVVNVVPQLVGSSEAVVTFENVVNNIDTFEYNVYYDIAETKMIVSKYSTHSEGWMYYIDRLSNIEHVYEVSNIDFTALVPIKQNGKFVKDKDRNYKKALKLFNMNSNDFKDSLADEKLINAYMMSGIDPHTQTPLVVKTLFQTFDMISELVDYQDITGVGWNPTIKNENFIINADELSMQYFFNIEKTVKDGVITKTPGTPIGMGKYSNTYAEYLKDHEDGGSYTSGIIILRKQISDTAYKEIKVFDLEQHYDIATDKSDRTVIRKIGSIGQTPVNGGGVDDDVENEKTDGDGLRMIVPLKLMNRLKYKDWCILYEDTFCILAYSTEKVELKWYQTGLFKFVLTVVMIVITMVRLYYGDIGAIKDFATFIEVVSTFVQQMAINYGIAYVAGELASHIGGTEGAIIGALFAMVATVLSPGGVDFGKDLWLPLANQAFDTINQGLEFAMNDIIATGESALRSLAEQNQELNKKLKDLDDNRINLAGVLTSMQQGMVDAGSVNPIFYTIEEYVDSVSNPENFYAGGRGLYNIDGQISSKQSVISGRG